MLKLSLEEIYNIILSERKYSLDFVNKAWLLELYPFDLSLSFYYTFVVCYPKGPGTKFKLENKKYILV